MKVLVVFGSKSDANIYDPLLEQLCADSQEVDFHMISVHRSRGLLDRELTNIRSQVAIVGAGLAAHLPGVLASKVLIPVFGIPCNAALGGVDSLLAMMQMPFGIPVLVSAPEKYNVVTSFIKTWSQMDLRFAADAISLVVDEKKANLPHYKLIMDRAHRIAEKAGISFEVRNTPSDGSVNICLEEVTSEKKLSQYAEKNNLKTSLQIFVPVLSAELYSSASSVEFIMQKIQTVPDSVWTSVNGIGNAFLAALQLCNGEGRYNAFLTNAKKGYVHD